MGRPPVLLAVLAVTAVGLGACSSVPEATPCPSDANLVFEPGGATFGLCEPGISVEPAEGSFGLWIAGGLPSAGPWGRGEGGARFAMTAERFAGPGRATGTATLGYGVEERGLMGNRSLGPTWEGTCDVDVGEPGDRMTFRCELAGGAGPGARLALTGDVPAPESIPVAELQATYRIGGDYVAEGTTPVALEPRAEGGVHRQMIPLVDGGLLQLLLEGEPDGRASLHEVPGNSPAIVGGRPGPLEDGAFTPSFGVCEMAIDPDTWTGTASCPGDPSSPAGSVTLELELYPAAP